MQRWLEQGSRVPGEGEDRPRVCADERRPALWTEPPLGCGQGLPFTHLPGGVSQPSGPRKCSHGPAPLDTYKDVIQWAWKLVVGLYTPCLAVAHGSFLHWERDGS